MFPKDRVMSSLKKYNIPFDPEASADALRRQLAEFYAQRTLTRQPITPEDQAEAAYFLLSDRTGRITGQVLQPKGVAVIIEAAHQCMTTRGIHKPGVTMVTSRMLGTFRDNPETRRELLTMIGSR